MEQWTGSKLGKEFVKAVHCHPTYLTSMQGTSCEMLGWMTHNPFDWTTYNPHSKNPSSHGIKIARRNINNLRYPDDNILLAESKAKLKRLLMKVKEESEVQIRSVAQLACFATPWTAACQSSLSITNYWSLLKLMSIESMMPSNHFILCRPLSFFLQSFQHQGLF